MTDDRFYFTQVPHWLQGTVSPRAIEVYVSLGRWASWDAETGMGQAWPSLATIAKTLHPIGTKSDKTAQRAIRELERAGAVRSKRRFERSNLYTLVGKEAEPFTVVDGNGEIRTPEVSPADKNVHFGPDESDLFGPDTDVRQNIDPGELDPEEPDECLETFGDPSFSRTGLTDRTNLSGRTESEEIQF